MAFFRTKDSRRDSALASGAREKRTQQLQAQQQLQARKAGTVIAEAVAPGGAAQ